MQCFSMQVVINKYFLLNPEEFARIRFVIFEKNAKKAHFTSENDATEPKARLL